MFQMWLAAVAFAMLVVLQLASSQVEAKSYQTYFTVPSDNKTFSEAVSWCNKTDNNSYNSSLAVVNDSGTQMALSRFLSSSSYSSTTPMFINLKLYELVPSTWYLVNGMAYIGSIGNQDSSGNQYLFNCRLRFDGSNFIVEASSSADVRNYICNFEESRCSSDPTENIVYKGRCYVKYENENLTWYEARERCVNKGGDLAQFQSSDGNFSPPFDTTWLDKELTYWVGIRWNGWSWKSSSSGGESIFTWWSNGKPNTFGYECVCVDPNGNPLWSWTDCDCNVQRQFVCIKELALQTTTPMTTTAITTTMIPTTTAEPVTTNGFSETRSNYTLTSATKADQTSPSPTTLIIGLAVGIGGGLILLIVVIVVVVVICKRRQRRSGGGSDSGSEGNIDAGYNDNVQNGVYAAVVPGKNQGKQTESKSETIYTSPVFTKEQNSQPPDHSYEAVDLVEEPDMVRSLNSSRGRTKSIYPQGNSDVYANAKEVPNATD